jgi:hypothetical protein
MLAMKEQFPHLRNGRPWRQKDITDMEILRGLVSPAGSRQSRDGVRLDGIGVDAPLPVAGGRA